MLLCRIGLFQGVVDDQVQEKIVSAQGAADLAAALEMDEELLVHELSEGGGIGVGNSMTMQTTRTTAHLLQLGLRCL